MTLLDDIRRNSVPRRIAVTLALSAGVVLAYFSSAATVALEGSRAAIADGQGWRFITGHATHWSGDHLFWDLAMFVVLGAALERRSRARFVVLVVISAFCISAAVLLVERDIVSYRGLSGIDSALFVALSLEMLADSRQGKRGLPAFVAIILLAAFVGKTAYEFATGDTLFVGSEAAGFVPLPLAHLVGAAVAWGCACVASAMRQRATHDERRLLLG